MAEAVGLVSSILALAEAALTLGKLIRRLHAAPAELLALSNEVNDLRYLLTEIEKVAQERPESQARLADSIKKTNIKVAAVRAFLEKFDIVETKALDRLVWIRYRNKIRFLQSELRDARLQLGALLAANISSTAHRIELLLEKVDFAVLRSTKEVEETRNIVIGQLGSVQHGQLQVQGSVTELLRAQTEDATSLTKVTSVPIQRYTGARYSSGCRCACHRQLRIQSLTTRFLGSLFLGYRGLPSFSSECSVAACKTTCGTVQVAFTYYFPTWMLSKAIFIAYSSSPYTGPMLLLNIRNIVPYGSPWFIAASQGDNDQLKNLLDVGQAQINDVDGDGYTALYTALAAGRLHTCEFLMQLGADSHIENRFQRSAFDKACQEMLEYRVANNAQPRIYGMFGNIADVVDGEWSLSDLHKAVVKILPRDVTSEIRHPDTRINLADLCGRTALWWAVRVRDLHAARILLKHGADPNISDVGGDAPLHTACSNGPDEMVRLLLEHGADVSRMSRAGCTALHNACKRTDAPTSTSTITALLDAGAALDTRNSGGYPALFYAIKQNMHDVVRLLLRRGVDYAARNGNGSTVLHAVALWADARTMDILAAHGLPGIDPSAGPSWGETALDLFERLKKRKREDQIERFYRLWGVVLSPASKNAAADFDGDGDAAEPSDEEDVFVDAPS